MKETISLPRQVARSRSRPRSPLPHAFATRRGGRLLTIGTAFATSAHRRLGPLTTDAVAVLAFFNAECEEPACARGKVVVADQDELSVRVFQTGSRRPSAVTCGNGTAAGAVLLARARPGGTVSFGVASEAGMLSAEARVRAVESEFSVAQRWQLPKDWSFTAATLPGVRRALFVRGLNPYLVIEAGEDLDPRPILTRTLGEHLLAARAVVLTHREQGPPKTRFYSLERAHGGAPQTGMATLAVAARAVDWVGELLATGGVEHPLGREALPALESACGALQCHLPPVLVGMELLEMEAPW